jgi:hypothetical protein
VLTSTATTANFLDTTAAPATAYLYRVRALDPAGNPGGYSAPDLATTVLFSDDPIMDRVTPVRAAHFDQLRRAVNAVREAAGLADASFTDPTLIDNNGLGITMKRIHLVELRTNLDQARAALALPILTYTDPTITQAVTPIRSPHMSELRNGVR